LLPLEELIKRNAESGEAKPGVQAIILEPTRELAAQVQTQISKYSSLKSALVYGGDARSSEQSKTCLGLKRCSV
jgi:superfamily II DNA/RNA helicase